MRSKSYQPSNQALDRDKMEEYVYLPNGERLKKNDGPDRGDGVLHVVALCLATLKLFVLQRYKKVIYLFVKVYERTPDSSCLTPTQRGIKLDIWQTRDLIDNVDRLIDATRQVGFFKLIFKTYKEIVNLSFKKKCHFCDCHDI